MKSIIQINTDECYLCGSKEHLEWHHVFNGNPNRKLSTKYLLLVRLCHNCHNEPPNGVHHCQEVDLHLKQVAERCALGYYHWSVDNFREIFGKNYL